MATVQIGAAEIIPAQVEGSSQNVFKASKFVLTKPAWESDDSASLCFLCKDEFTQIRRRHHCRCCGRVLCSKCCSNKVPIPQYMADAPERVCNACLPVVSSVTMLHSTDHEYHEQAVTSLEMICRNNPGSVISLGGAHILIYLTRLVTASNMKILNKITTCLLALSMHFGALQWLAEIGILDALNYILHISSTARDQPKMATEALNTLRIYVRTSDALKRKAVLSGCVSPLLDFGESDNPLISLIAMTTLSLIAECSENHEAILSQKNALRKLLTRISASTDEQEIEVVLRIMTLMSAGNEATKHMIVCEDSSVGSAICKVFLQRSKNSELLTHAACTIANLAASSDDQTNMKEGHGTVGLQNSLQSMLSVLNQNLPGYVTVHCIRALGNFAKHEIHVNTMLSNMANILRFLDTTYGPGINSYAVKCVFNILKHRRTETVKLLERFGEQNLILRLAELDTVMLDLLQSLDRVAASTATG